jgi:hypothetical protein
MTVLRKNKGRRWCIIYAGSEEGWMGEPWIWEADSRSADYHENMNANMFDSYMNALCNWCVTKYPGRKIVFCMDNAKYHRREYQANPTNDTVSETEAIETIDDYLRLKVSRHKGRKAGKVGGKVENDLPQKSVSQLSKEQLVLRIAPLLASKYKPLKVETIAAQLRTCKKATLYDLARMPENVLPLSTEVIAQR